MEKTTMIQEYCRKFNLTGIAQNFEQVHSYALKQQVSYLDYVLSLLKMEANNRDAKNLERQLKAAKLPINQDLEKYDHAVENGMTKTQLNQLKELTWIDQIYNIVLMGPSGTGKSFIASGLCYQAVKHGYKAYFRTIDDLLNTLKMKEYTRSAMADYRRLLKANLIVIDDIMLFPIDKPTAVNLFNFINNIFENTAFIITTNKSPKEWSGMLNDQVLATALLDRLLYRCEIINLTGKSYRMENRKTIFKHQ